VATEQAVPPAPPVATYRLQLTAAHGLDHAATLVPYLAELGISHLYLSPIFEAVPGSTHGYDGTDPTHVRAELGGREALARLRDAADEHGLGIVLDVVPNHLAADTSGPWWRDLLRDGPDSVGATIFDVYWQGGAHRPAGTVLLPILGRPLDEVVADGELHVATGANGEPELRYFEHRFPLADGSPAATPDDPASMLLLLQRQHYRLAHWKVAQEEVGYRRFFDITGLVGLRVEVPATFERALDLAIDLVREGTVDGLRLDHVDGLADPKVLLDRLADRTHGVWTLVEKVLVGDEQLRSDWATDGTTGYEAGALIGRVLTDPSGADALLALHAEVTGERRSWHEVVQEAKAEVLDRSFRPEHELITRHLVAALGEPAADEEEVRAAVGALATTFDVYRVYPDATGPLGIEDAFRLRTAADRSRSAAPGLAPVVDRIEALLLAGGAEEAATARTRFVQLSGPLMAKGVEDTALYRWVPLVGAGDVGAEPWPLGCDVGRFHEQAAAMAAHPKGLVATSTHDSKRSEDVRARLILLSELAEEWSDLVGRLTGPVVEDQWGHRAPADLGDPALEVDGTTRLLLWQTVVGAWPVTEERVQAYLQKAVREAKRHTGWTDPDEAYEEAVRRLVSATFADSRRLEELEAFADRLVIPGRINALAQLLLKLTLPGVPDVYQGNEIWRLDLTDPDNRRAVGWDRRRLLLRTARGAGVEDVWPESVTGLPKLWLLHRALGVRRSHPDAFAGGYEPVLAEGPAADHVVAFHRGDGETGVVVVVPRHPIRLEREGGWRSTEVVLPDGAWHDVLAERPTWRGAVPVQDLLGPFPVALLVRG
jgi:(1->4)-alpha-D-glucan 1-alpha-D-glucosylmutase